MTNEQAIAEMKVFSGETGRADKAYVDALSAQIAADCIELAGRTARKELWDGSRMSEEEFAQRTSQKRYGCASKVRMRYEYQLALSSGWSPVVVNGCPAAVSPNGACRMVYSPVGATKVQSRLERAE